MTLLRRRNFVLGSVLLTAAACMTGTGGNQETYQHLMRMACAAPSNIMEQVLTTDQLKLAWAFICAHVDGIPRTPVPMQDRGFNA